AEATGDQHRERVEGSWPLVLEAVDRLGSGGEPGGAVLLAIVGSHPEVARRGEHLAAVGLVEDVGAAGRDCRTRRRRRGRLGERAEQLELVELDLVALASVVRQQ